VFCPVFLSCLSIDIDRPFHNRDRAFYQWCNSNKGIGNYSFKFVAGCAVAGFVAAGFGIAGFVDVLLFIRRGPRNASMVERKPTEHRKTMRASRRDVLSVKQQLWSFPLKTALSLIRFNIYNNPFSNVLFI